MQSFAEAERSGWERNAARYDSLVGPATNQGIGPIFDRIGDLAGKRLLDIACGTGDLAGAAAARGAQVDAIDFAAPMIEAARTKIANASFQVADCLDLPYADETFDAVTCCFGLLHVADNAAAMAQAARVLKPGGKIAYTAWCSPQDGGAFLGMVFGTFGKHADMEVELPPAPPMFELADATRSAELLTQAGFTDVASDRFEVSWTAPDADGVAAILNDGLVRAGLILRAQTPERRAQVLAALADAARPHVTGNGFAMTNSALLVTATKR
ncbi:MAG: methyltransferase domain-containing protein [Alphaproteobacteria bacterium]